MKEETTQIEKEVKSHQLSSDMTITAYTGFGRKYQLMDSSVCRFLKHNFKGTKVLITRDQENLDIQISGLQVKDTLLQIYDFPPSLEKLTTVNERLVKALKYREIHQFSTNKKAELAEDSKRELREMIELVNASTKRPTKKEEKRQDVVRETQELVRKVNESVKVRQNASASVENLMDNARRGYMNIDEISTYIDGITQNSSSEAMSAIASIKASDQTYAHCIDVGVIFQSTYHQILQETGRISAFESIEKTILSAFLHDFGKSKIPKDILDSTLRFERESQEMKIMRSHTEYGAELLAGMNMPNSIINMAHYHHVKHDPSMLSSYPEGCKYENVLFETRLLSIIDAYQALVGRRKYKRSWSPPATMRYIDALSGVEYDLEIWELFLGTMGLYPKGSLVELTNNALGFVMSVPKNGEDLERPIIAVVRNEYGEDLTHHDLVNLQEERNLSISKDLDNQEVFGNNALEVFMSIEVA